MGIWDELDDTPVEPKKYNKKSDKTPEELAIQSRYSLRCKLINLSKTDFNAMMQFLRENESRFRNAGYTDDDKKELRRACRRAFSAYPFAAEADDMELCDRLFGYYTESRPPGSVLCRYNHSDPYTQPFDSQIKWFMDSSYEAFWNWITRPETRTSAISNPRFRARLEVAIATAVRNNYVIRDGRRCYQPEDDEFFRQFLDEIPQMEILSENMMYRGD